MIHAHSEIVKALAEDTTLALLFKVDGYEWDTSVLPFPRNDRTRKYYLCHPKHIDATLHWLNGGCVDYYGEYFTTPKRVNPREDIVWSSSVIFMSDRVTIEPVNEHWVLFNTDTGNLINTVVYTSKPKESPTTIAIKLELPK